MSSDCESCEYCDECNRPTCHTIQSCSVCKVDFVNGEPQCVGRRTCDYCDIPLPNFCIYTGCYNCLMCAYCDGYAMECTCGSPLPILEVKCTCRTCRYCNLSHKECKCESLLIKHSDTSFKIKCDVYRKVDTDDK